MNTNPNTNGTYKTAPGIEANTNAQGEAMINGDTLVAMGEPERRATGELMKQRYFVPEACVDWIDRVAQTNGHKSNGFAKSLRDQITNKGGLTHRQLIIVARGIERDANGTGNQVPAPQPLPAQSEPQQTTATGGYVWVTIEHLMQITRDDLLAVYKTANGGSFGFDYARVNKKPLAEKLLANFDRGQIARAIDTVNAHKSASAKTDPKAIKTNQPQPEPKTIMSEPEPVTTEPEPVDMSGALINNAQPEPVTTEPVSADAGDRLLTALNDLTRTSVDAATVRKIAADVVDKAMEGFKPETQVVQREIKVVTPTATNVITEHTHPVFDKVLKVAASGHIPLMIGPAGCGKTHLFGQVAKALDKTYASISGSAGVSESHITGFLLPTGEHGRFEYHESPFVSQYTSESGAFLFDELDAFDPNCLMTANQALANGGFHVATRVASGLDTFVKRAAGSILGATANTNGGGADLLYTARAAMDAATRSRFYPIMMDFDREYELQVGGQEICDWIWALREKVARYEIREVVSTRMVIQLAELSPILGLDTVKTDLLSVWSESDRQKCGV